MCIWRQSSYVQSINQSINLFEDTLNKNDENKKKLEMRGKA